jgi:hypothetical protein
MHSAQCTVHSVQCTVHSVHCTDTLCRATARGNIKLTTTALSRREKRIDMCLTPPTFAEDSEDDANIRVETRLSYTKQQLR